MRGLGSFQPSEIKEGIKLVGLNISNWMKRNEQMAVKQEALGTFYPVPGLCFGTRLSRAHNSCSPGSAACGSSRSHRHPQRIPPWSQCVPSPSTASSGGISLLLSQLAADQTRCGHTYPGQGVVLLIISVQTVSLFKHCGKHMSTTGSFNTAGACRGIKALS